MTVLKWSGKTIYTLDNQQKQYNQRNSCRSLKSVVPRERFDSYLQTLAS